MYEVETVIIAIEYVPLIHIRRRRQFIIFFRMNRVQHATRSMRNRMMMMILLKEINSYKKMKLLLTKVF